MRLLPATVSVLLSALPAAAHVSVSPREAPARTFQLFSIRVPTERGAATTSVRVRFPPGLASIRFQPKPGWKREIERDGKGEIVAVRWSGGRIETDEFDEFHFTARLPGEPTTLLFEAYQTYEDGEVVAWVEKDGKRPAPTVRVLPAAPPGTAEPHRDAR